MYKVNGIQTGPTTPTAAGPCADHDRRYICVTLHKATVAILPLQENETYNELLCRAHIIVNTLNETSGFTKSVEPD